MSCTIAVLPSMCSNQVFLQFKKAVIITRSHCFPFPGNVMYLDDPYSHTDVTKDGSGDSGVSTPDPAAKPKKVIHEVIV